MTSDGRLKVEIVADVDAAVSAFAKLGRAINGLAIAVRRVIDLFNAGEIAARYAIEHLDIPESDIRYATVDAVTPLWNGRIVPLPRPSACLSRRTAMTRWRFKFDVSDVFHNDALTVAEKSKTIAERLRKVRWFDLADDTDREDLLDYADAISCMDNADDFDHVWNAFYDWCDLNRVWVTTR